MTRVDTFNDNIIMYKTVTICIFSISITARIHF